MPASGEPTGASFITFIAAAAQVVMLLSVKSSSQGKVPALNGWTADHVQVLSHFPPKSPKLDAAALIFWLVKVNQGPAGVTTRQTPSISAALTLRVQATVAAAPFGPACIVHEPPKSK